MIKETMTLIISSAAAVCLCGCSANTAAASAEPSAVPTAAASALAEAVQNTSGIEKYETAVDYSLPEHWLAMPEQNNKAVDLLYFY